MKTAYEKIGTVIAGKYRIDSFIQRGGMGSVFKGRHLDLGRDVALKLFHRDLVRDNRLVIRFLNEARGTASLRHKNIVDVIDIGMDDDGLPFFVMEYLQGESLKGRLKNKRRLTLKESADIMIQVLGGLQAAHSKGIIHRDIKPSNIMIAKEDDGSEIVKLLDFGIARFLEAEKDGRPKLTTAGSFLGTPAYMSPEQLTGAVGDVDHRTDIYSSGVVLFQCLTGQNPFMSGDIGESVQKVLGMKVLPPSSLAKEIPQQADAVVLAAMERDRGRRYPDCKSFIQSLQSFYTLESRSPADRARGIPAGRQDAARAAPKAPAPRTRTPPSRLLPLLFLVPIAAALLAIAALLTVMTASKNREASHSSEARRVAVTQLLMQNHLRLPAANVTTDKAAPAQTAEKQKAAVKAKTTTPADHVERSPYEKDERTRKAADPGGEDLKTPTLFENMPNIKTDL